MRLREKCPEAMCAKFPHLPPPEARSGRFSGLKRAPRPHCKAPFSLRKRSANESGRARRRAGPQCERIGTEVLFPPFASRPHSPFASRPHGKLPQTGGSRKQSAPTDRTPIDKDSHRQGTPTDAEGPRGRQFSRHALEKTYRENAGGSFGPARLQAHTATGPRGCASYGWGPQ